MISKIRIQNNKLYAVRTIPKCNRDIVDTEAKLVPLIHDRLDSWLITSIKSDEIKPVLWAQIPPPTEMMRSCKCFPHMRKGSTLTYN